MFNQLSFLAYSLGLWDKRNKPEHTSSLKYEAEKKFQQNISILASFALHNEHHPNL